jgi:diguanylate cyclase (GGDEF)-like protein
MAVVLVITWNLQYMIVSSPDAGGIYTFEKRVGSKDLGFLAAWFVLLTYMAILWANATSVPLFARFFLGDAFRFGFHYQIFGYEVWFGEALLSICALLLIGMLCIKSTKITNIVMIIAALTGVRNRHAYLEAEDQLNRLIADRTQPGFAITVFDVNDLKSVNDNEGHHAGDMCLCSACKIICDIFKHSQVFRVGGDEFAVISQNDDYDRIEEPIEKVKSHNASAIRTGGIVIACGTAKYENDSFVASVFERADRQMYENKDHLKTLTHPET